MEPSDDISITSKAEVSAPLANIGSAADQQTTASSDSLPDMKPNAPTQTFKRSKYLQQDVGVLYVAYVIQESTELRELICEVDRISLNELFKDALKASVPVVGDLVAALDLKPVPDGVNAAISTFLAALKKIDSVKSSANDALRIVERAASQIKGDHPHIFTIGQQRSGRFKAIMGGILGVALPVVNILKEAAPLIPVPMIQPLIGVVANFLNAADESSNNCERMRWLAATTAEYIVHIIAICPENADSQWGSAINRLTPKLQKIVDEAADYSKHSVTSRVFKSGSDKGNIELMKEDLAAALNLFYFNIGSDVAIKLDSMARNIEGLYLETLPRLPEHSVSHDRYFPGSRQDEIQETLKWVEADSGEQFLWYHGAAGVGKSVYSRQLLDHIKGEGMLGTFAYFAIGIDSSSKDLVCMMARELADLHPGCRPGISDAIQNCAGTNRGLDEYITHFLIQPISSLSYSGPLVIILDSLDEWAHHKDFLSTLISLPHTRSLKFIMTSRYSTLIDTIVSSKARIRNLTPVSATVCHNYFKGRFDAIDWDGHYPESHILERVVELADGLLIWAATVCTLVSEPSPHDEPHDILNSILISSSKVARRDGMKALYKLAMERIFPNDNEESKQSRCNILLAMSVLKAVLPLEEFICLAGPIRTKFVKETLMGMRALQTRGEFNETVVQPAIMLFHTSFIEYLAMSEEARTDMLHHCITFLQQSSNAPANVGEKLFRPVELYIGKHLVNHLCEVPPDLNFKYIQELESCHISKWVAWSLAPLIITGEENGFPVGSPSLLTLSESLLYEQGIIFSPELMTHDQTSILDMSIAGFWRMLNLLNVFRHHGDAFAEVPKHEVDKWIHVLNGLLITSLQTLQLKHYGAVNIMTTIIDFITMIRQYLPSQSCTLSFLENHALALETIFEYGGNLNDLKGALALHRDVQARLSEETPGCSIDVLDESILLHQQALDHDPNDHYKRATFLDDLGIALHTKYLIEDPEDPAAAIEKIINYHLEAIKLRSTHPTHLPLLLNNLSSALQSRSQLQEENAREDLEQALLYSLLAASARNLGSSVEHSTYITTVGYALRLVSHAQPRISLHDVMTHTRWQLNETMKKHLFDYFSFGTQQSFATDSIVSTMIIGKLKALVVLVRGIGRFGVPRPEVQRFLEMSMRTTLFKTLAMQVGGGAAEGLLTSAMLAQQAALVGQGILLLLGDVAEAAEVKPENGKLAEGMGQPETQAEQSKAGQAGHTEEKREFAKQIKELLYDIDLDALSLHSASSALHLLPPGAPSRSATILLRNNIDDEEPVKGRAFLRLRARPLAALPEIDRQDLMKAAIAFSQPSDSRMEDFLD
ncbi:hypothetical protein D9619_008971 [Psilocybe cf. subviscida]|uniref:Nephrocystin 3-like N-terminal domain-containing protein n=1 Tax=Psilocybe cf. subviscida TaxID=2480587 RepID=A0A8H5BVQ4_9AGAR|nr:hypothetical protein D9619_008971 [Psilocybe cf. subviscida]